MKDFWKELRRVREEYRIRPVPNGNDLARKRITLLVTDCLLKTFTTVSQIHRIPFMESCLWNTLKDLSFQCDHLPGEEGHRGYGPAGYLGLEKIYTNDHPWSEDTRSFVRDIVKFLSERSEEDEPAGDNHGKGAYGTAGHRREHHVPAKAERPALYTAQSHKEGVLGGRGPGMDKGQPD